MHTFIIEDLICESCSSALTETIHHADPHARVMIDLEHYRVEIDSHLSHDELASRLLEAGYNPKEERA
ncbi:MAG: hypothetical protein ACRCRW_07175 [Aeromonadaceae bacterium]